MATKRDQDAGDSSPLVGVDLHRKMLTAAVKARRPALAIGETGTGKTSLALEVLAAHCPAGVRRVNLNGGTTPDELEGRFQLKGQETYFQTGVLVECMKEGKGLLLDELNAALPDTLFVIHALLETPPRLYLPETGEDVVAHPDFTVVATMNPSHEYAGTRTLNMALYSRFAIVLRFETLTGEGLLKALVAHCPTADMDTVLKVADVIDQLTALRQAQKLTTPIGIREGLAALTFAADGLTTKEAIVAAMANKLDPEERPAASAVKLLAATKKGAAYQSVAALVALAERAEALQAEGKKLEQRMARYGELVEALRKAGLQTVEDVEGRLKAPTESTSA